MRRQLGVYFLALSFMLVFTAKVPATAPTFTTIDAPGAIYTEGVDINDFGLIVGRYYDGLPPCTTPCTNADTHNHGYLRDQQGNFTTINFPNPNTVFTAVAGINLVGDSVGLYRTAVGGVVSPFHGFLRSGGQFTAIDVPMATPPFGTRALGINLSGNIVGDYADGTGRHGFLRSEGVFTTIDPPRSISTTAWKINFNGDIVGRYTSADGKSHVFLLSGGQFISIDFPSAFDTAPASIPFVGFNAQGDIVSTYCDDPCTLSDGNVHGFLLSGGKFTPFDVPGAVNTVASGINSNDGIVGVFSADASGMCSIPLSCHGFLRSSP